MCAWTILDTHVTNGSCCSLISGLYSQEEDGGVEYHTTSTSDVIDIGTGEVYESNRTQ